MSEQKQKAILYRLYALEVRADTRHQQKRLDDYSYMELLARIKEKIEDIIYLVY